MAWPIFLGLLLAVGVFLALSARAGVLTAVGGLLLLLAATVFAVRLGHAGPYPFPRGMDLVSGLLNLFLGLLLFWRGAGSRERVRESLAIRLLLALTPAAFLFGLVSVAHELEEVVVLRTSDEMGGVLETRLWIVDHSGTSWVLTGSETRAVRRMEVNPEVELVRRGSASCHVAEVFENLETVREISLRRREKYRVERIAWALGYPRLFYDEEELEALQPGASLEGVSIEGAAAVRLDPCSARP